MILANRTMIIYNPVPKVKWQPVLIQNIFREVLSFTTASEGFVKLWIDFRISLNQRKIQRKNSVFFWVGT